MSLSWNIAVTSLVPTGYLLEAGTTPTSFDLLSLSLSSAAPVFEATNVPPGTYFVRLRGINRMGLGLPSATIAVHVP